MSWQLIRAACPPLRFRCGNWDGSGPRSLVPQGFRWQRGRIYHTQIIEGAHACCPKPRPTPLDKTHSFVEGGYVSRTKIAQGKDREQWHTVPISKSGSPTICEVRVADLGFATKHLSTLRQNYAGTPHHDEVLDLLAPVHERAGESLATFNMDLIRTIAAYLGWEGKFVMSSNRPSDLKADERLADLVSWLGGTRTYQAPAGRSTRPTTTAASSSRSARTAPSTTLGRAGTGCLG
jgi:WbqC-like protein family